MRKAIIDKATDEVLNVAVVSDPLTLDATVVKRVIRPARPEARWTNKKTGGPIIKAAMPEEARYVFNSPGHGLKPTSAPLVPSGDVPPELESVPYFVKVIDENDFLLMDSVDGPPIEITPNKDGVAVMLTEIGYDPGPARELVDDDGTAQAGSKYTRATGKFDPPPAPPPPPSQADHAEAAVRGKPEMLALGRIATGNDALTEDELIAAIRGKLGG